MVSVFSHNDIYNNNNYKYTNMKTTALKHNDITIYSDYKYLTQNNNKRGYV